MTDQLNVSPELELEIALSLLPLLGRCLELEDGHLVGQHGNRLDDTRYRRILVQDVARRWCLLTADRREQYSADHKAATAEFTIEYVDKVEGAELDDETYRTYGHDAAVEQLWRRHIESLAP